MSRFYWIARTPTETHKLLLKEDRKIASIPSVTVSNSSEQWAMYFCSRLPHTMTVVLKKPLTLFESIWQDKIPPMLMKRFSKEEMKTNNNCILKSIVIGPDALC